MQDITKTFTIQWVGPFRNLQKMNEYLKDASTCDKSLFNFTISPATKKVPGIQPKSSTVISEYIKRVMVLRNASITTMNIIKNSMKMKI